MAVSNEFREELVRAYRNMTHYNDVHPAGGTNASRNTESTICQFLRELDGETPVPLKLVHDV